MNLVDSDDLPIEAVALADGGGSSSPRGISRPMGRNIYSHTKSYVSTAIGIAVEEGILSLDGKLVDAFPEYVPADAQPELGRITLRHLLTMSSGFNHAYLMSPDRRGGVGAPDYLKYMFSSEVGLAGGAILSIRTWRGGRRAWRTLARVPASHDLLAARTGWPIWECDPQGHPIVGAGMFMTLADMLKLGQVYLNGGTWRTRIVGESW